MQTGGSRETSKLLMDRSSAGRMGVVPPALDVPVQPLPEHGSFEGKSGFARGFGTGSGSVFHQP